VDINGEPVQLSAFKSLVGFVPQEDIMIRNLTVEENLRFCAFSRLPADWSEQRKLERVMEYVGLRHPVCMIEDCMKHTLMIVRVRVL
jgi:ABC-type multidrug transport system ATPase subunit